jgi:hypothetical protein
MSSSRCNLLLVIALPLLLAPFCVQAQDDSKSWSHSIYIYAMGAAIDGKAQIGPVQVPVDLSASDVFSALEFGAMAAYRAENGTWSFSADTTYMNLAGSDTTDGGLLLGKLDVDQLTLMASVGRRVSENTEILFGLAYVDVGVDLRVTSAGPLPVDLVASRDADWIDPTVGLRYNRPFSDRWCLNLRADVGGFGVGSEFMYHLLANVEWKASEAVGIVFGYRLIDFDYKDGNNSMGGNYQNYDLTEQGPLLGVSISF